MKKNNDRDMTPHAGCTFESVARVTKLFGGSDGGGVVLSLYDSFPEDFDPAEDPLFVQIDSLDVPLWCATFDRRGAAGAVVSFDDLDTPHRAEELVGRELRIPVDEEQDDEFYMEDLIGFTVEADGHNGIMTDYYDSDANPLFGIDFGEGERLIPAVEDFIASIDFERRHIRMVLPEGLLDL
mgnify:FL=1